MVELIRMVHEGYPTLFDFNHLLARVFFGAVGSPRPVPREIPFCKLLYPLTRSHSLLRLANVPSPNLDSSFDHAASYIRTRSSTFLKLSSTAVKISKPGIRLSRRLQACSSSLISFHICSQIPAYSMLLSLMIKLIRTATYSAQHP